MASIKESAQEYVPKQTLNIADLDRVDLSWELKEGSGTTNEGKDFKYFFFEVNELEYRVPGKVLEKIKDALAIRPDINFVKVNSQGSGVATKYTLSVLD